MEGAGVLQRTEDAVKTVKSFHELASRDRLNDVEQDALLHRFELAFDCLWKCAKEYLYAEEGIDAASPKKVIRCCRELGLLDEGQTAMALQMADDRNLTTHTYDESFAKAVVERIREYDPLLQTWLDQLQ